MIISADDFFMQGGKYVYNAYKIGEAHSYCLRTFFETVRVASLANKVLKVVIMRGLPGSGKTSWAEKNKSLFDVCIDNTNTTSVEIAPYAAVTLAYGHKMKIVVIKSKPEFAAVRNIHGVPPIQIGMMYQRMLTDKLPPWWDQEEVRDDEIDLPRKTPLFVLP